MDPRTLMTDTKQRLGDIGAAFYFDEATLARGKQLGLSGMRFYALGRGGVLGDVDPAVVRSAFGYFAPALLEKWWVQAREVMAPREAAREYIACCHEFGRRVLAGVDGLHGFVDAASTVIDAAEGHALALFAGVRAEPVPDDTAAAAIHQAMVLRELRGSAHLAAIAAVGLGSAVAHAIKRPDDVATFGYDEPPTVTDADRAKHQRAEDVTDDVLEPAYSALSEAQATAFVAGVEAMHAAVTGR
jgi:hypothetical protein